ncbi:hypothetical protein ACIBF1_20095 [Spirillospora sp. NPDC050679]
MADDLAAVWDAFAANDAYPNAASPDPDLRWDSTNLRALVRAVRRTSLSRLFPFTSLYRFCLGDGADFWAAGTDGGHIAPAFVNRNPEDGYQVMAGNPYHETQDAPVLITQDPEAAARCLEELLIGWPRENPPA